jgi:hypothetical protein
VETYPKVCGLQCARGGRALARISICQNATKCPKFSNEEAYVAARPSDEVSDLANLASSGQEKRGDPLQGAGNPAGSRSHVPSLPLLLTANSAMCCLRSKGFGTAVQTVELDTESEQCLCTHSHSSSGFLSLIVVEAAWPRFLSLVPLLRRHRQHQETKLG